MLLFYQVATRLLLTTCRQIVELQDDNKLLEQFVTSCWNNLWSVELNNLVASCQQAVDNLSTSWEQAVRTHLVDKLLERYCYMSAAGLLQLVRFYVCSIVVTTWTAHVVSWFSSTPPPHACPAACTSRDIKARPKYLGTRLVTTIVFKAGRPGFNLWSDVYSRSYSS
jgi:hypothetical protein